MDIRNKIVVITGSSSGIGKTTAIRFAKEGAKIVINCKTNSKGGEETKKAIEDIGGECLLIQADVSKPEEIETFFQTIEKTYKTVDILINNAAIPNDKVPYPDAPYDVIEEMVKPI